MQTDSSEILAPPKGRRGVFIKTFGCQMNEYDSEKMFLLLADQYDPVQTAEEADVIIINTCSVRDKAEQKLFNTLGWLKPLKTNNPKLIVGVGGCVAQQEGSTILERSRLVDFVVGTHNLSLIPSLVSAAQLRGERSVAVDYREDWEELPDQFDAFSPTDASGSWSAKAFGTFYSPVRALVAISRGCNKNCSFCVVPNTRGPEVSRDMLEIEREVRQKVRLGAREVMLLGQTVNSYGKDLSPRVRFEDLIERLSKIEQLKRIRFTSPHPAEVRPSFIELYQRVPELCPHIHLPLQSGSDRILKLMNRNYRVERYLEIVDQLRVVCPQLAITSDIIVGFPTESEADFEMTLEVMRRVRYNLVFSFKYSRRPNTAAAERFEKAEEIASELQQERLQRLMLLQEQISTNINQELLGKTCEALVEGTSRNSSSMRGRIPQNTPIEIIGGSPKIGDLVMVEVIRTGPYGLRGQVVQGIPAD